MTRRDERHDVLFEPLRIGPKTIRNRFYQVPHCTGFGVDKPFTQADFRGIKAEGGWGAVCTEYCSISPESDEWPYFSAKLWDKEDVRSLGLMVEAVHAHGALAGVELWHGGALVLGRESRLAPLAPSQLANDHLGVSVPQAMTAADIRRVRDDWVAAARRAREAGFDIVYAYGSHGYLPTQFLSTRTNRRADAYGGSFENRARFWLELIEAMRDAVGDQMAIAVRIAADGLDSAGVDPEEGWAFIRAADHLVDLWDLSVGAVEGARRLDSGASRFYREGYQAELEWTRRARQATAKPIIGVGRYTSPDLMASLVTSGVQDLIGAARPSIADPFLPVKVEQGRYDEIRECIGCNACYSRAVYGNHLGCTQNATAGEEYRRGWHPERFAPAANADRDVLVVGAGPAGLECAIVLAKRGFQRIHLVCGDDDIGGCLRWIPRLPGLGDWARVVDWRRIQRHRLRRQIELVTSTRLTAADVRAYGAELVVVATGSHWAADGTNGISGGPVSGAERALTPEAIMLAGERPRPGDRVLVYDAEGYYMGASMAELLAAEGFTVALVTPEHVVAPRCDETLEAVPLRRRLHDLGVSVRTGTTLEAIGEEYVLLEGEFGDRWDIACDRVVLVTQRLSEDALYHELCGDPDALAREGIEAVYRAGDCVAPRLIADAVFDGHRLAREIDGPHPQVALPWRRERTLV
jgi:dimethylamine/trimethylamine dehydrogenase